MRTGVILKDVRAILSHRLYALFFWGVTAAFAVAQQPVLEFEDFKPVPKKWKNTFFKSGIM